MADVDRFGKTFECRLCGGNRSRVVLDFGLLPLSNDFVQPGREADETYREPIVFVICDDCRLLQLRHLVPPERLFGTYLWTSSTSVAAQEYAGRFSRMLAERFPPVRHPLLVELASNDGLLLRQLAAVGYEVLGVEPSNLADEVSAAGIPTYRAFFGSAVAAELRKLRGPADVIVARNVIGHVADLRGLLAGVAHLLRPGGVFVVESPYALSLRNALQYDTIFHEHVSYFTVTTLNRALVRFGLAPSGITFVELNGGSFLCEARREDEPRPNRALDPLLELEKVIELNEPHAWAHFSSAVGQQRQALRGLLSSLVADGAVLVAYGAAAKTVTMLNVCRVGPDLIRVVADANPRKQGLLCPGVHIPVVSPDEMLRLDPDYVLIGPWNMASEIVGLLRTKRYRGKFVVALPMPHVLSDEPAATA